MASLNQAKVTRVWIKYFRDGIPDILYKMSFFSLDAMDDWRYKHPQYSIVKMMMEYDYPDIQIVLRGDPVDVAISVQETLF